MRCEPRSGNRRWGRRGRRLRQRQGILSHVSGLLRPSDGGGSRMRADVHFSSDGEQCNRQPIWKKSEMGRRLTAFACPKRPEIRDSRSFDRLSRTRPVQSGLQVGFLRDALPIARVRFRIAGRLHGFPSDRTGGAPDGWPIARVGLWIPCRLHGLGSGCPADCAGRVLEGFRLPTPPIRILARQAARSASRWAR